MEGILGVSLAKRIVIRLLTSSGIRVCYSCSKVVGMPPFLGEKDVLELVADYIGFAPSRFFLKQCSRDLHRELSGVVNLSEADFFEALDRKLVNPRYLRLRIDALSDSVISKVLSRLSGAALSIMVESLVEGRRAEELMVLETGNLQEILACSVLRMNFAMFDMVFRCLQEREYGQELMSELLRREKLQRALMEADALEWLKTMVTIVPRRKRADLAEDLMVYATKFRAEQCAQFLLTFTRKRKKVPGMLEAHAYAGNLEAVKVLCRNADKETIQRALNEAIEMLHMDIASYLRAEWYKRYPVISDVGKRMALVGDVLHTLYVPGKALHVEPSAEFLSWLFEGIDDVVNCWIGKRSLLEFACDARLKTMCHYLVERGSTSITFRSVEIKLEKNDLLDLLDLCCSFKKGSYNRHSDWNPASEMFLLKRGVDVWRRGDYGENPIIGVLRDGVRRSALSECVDLVHNYLTINPTWATTIARDLDVVGYVYYHFRFNATPLGYLEVLGTPTTEIWTGGKTIGVADFVSLEELETSAKDDWELKRPDEKEVQAVLDIRSLLLEHGADPGFLFAPDTLSMLCWYGKEIQAKLIRRLIQGRADVNHKYGYGRNPLNMAIEFGHSIEVIKVLLEAGASVEANNQVDAAKYGLNRDDVIAHNVLWYALNSEAAMKNPELLRLLLERRTDPDVPEWISQGVTALPWLLSTYAEEKYEAADVLLEYKADINARDDSGRTAVFRAVEERKVENLDWLIKRGADVDIPNNDGTRIVDLINVRLTTEKLRKIQKIIADARKPPNNVAIPPIV